MKKMIYLIILELCFSSLLFNQTFSQSNHYQLKLVNTPLNYKIEKNNLNQSFDNFINQKREIKKGIRWMMIGSALQILGGAFMITDSHVFWEWDSHTHYNDWSSYTSVSDLHSHLVIGMPIVAGGAVLNLYGLWKIYKSLK